MRREAIETVCGARPISNSKPQQQPKLDRTARVRIYPTAEQARTLGAKMRALGIVRIWIVAFFERAHALQVGDEDARPDLTIDGRGADDSLGSPHPFARPAAEEPRRAADGAGGRVKVHSDRKRRPTRTAGDADTMPTRS